LPKPSPLEEKSRTPAKQKTCGSSHLQAGLRPKEGNGEDATHRREGKEHRKNRGPGAERDFSLEKPRGGGPTEKKNRL